MTSFQIDNHNTLEDSGSADNTNHSVNVDTNVSLDVTENKSSDHSVKNNDDSDDQNQDNQLPQVSYEVLENSIFTQYHDRLNWIQYLLQGYDQYLQWLRMSIGYEWQGQINFCIARGINELAKYPIMGQHIEYCYWIHKCERELPQSVVYDSVPKSAVNTIKKTIESAELVKPKYIKNILQSQLKVSAAFTDQLYQQYVLNPRAFDLTLTQENMNCLLAHAIHTQEANMREHSQITWRLNHPASTHQLWVQKNSAIDLNGLLRGESLIVPASRHLGVQLLYFQGYVQQYDAFSDESILSVQRS
jgi:hypothetical protein